MGKSKDFKINVNANRVSRAQKKKYKKATGVSLSKGTWNKYW